MKICTYIIFFQNDLITNRRFLTTLSNNGHTPVSYLNSGAEGLVMKSSMAGHFYAIKVCHKPLKDKATFLRLIVGEPDEEEAWRTFDHPNLISWLNTFADSRQIYFVMPLATVGSLHDLVFDPQATLTEMQLRHLLKQIISACTYLKDLGFSHGDLKLPNFLIFDKLLLKLFRFWVPGPLVSQSRTSLSFWNPVAT